MLSLYWFSLQKYFCIDNANLIKNFKSTKKLYIIEVFLRFSIAFFHLIFSTKKIVEKTIDF